MDFSSYRIVDLTHTIVPGQGARPITIERVPAPEAVPDGLWYIMHRLEMPLNHVGTHIEAPYHIDPHGADLAGISLEDMCGLAAVLDLRGVPPGGIVSEEDMRRAAAPAGGLHHGDIALLRFDYDFDSANNRAFSVEAIGYLVSSGVKLVGTDLLGIELPASDPRHAEQYNHHQLLGSGICLIEQVAHLAELSAPRVLLMALSVPISGLDSFPIRVVAFEPRDGGQQ